MQTQSSAVIALHDRDRRDRGRSAMILLLCTLAAGLLPGCGGGGSASTPNPGPTPNPAPTVASVSPTSAVQGDPAFTLTVSGASFVPSSTVQWNGSARSTTFVSSTTLQAAITIADLVTANATTITVSTPAPGGGTSAPVNFTIQAAVPVVMVSPGSANVAAGGQMQFQGAVTHTQNTALTWQVNNVTGGSAATGTISGSGLYVAPVAATNVTVTAISQADTNQSASANLAVLAPHSIAVRPTATVAEFFDKTTGNPFVPRGNSYIRLAFQTYPDGSIQSYHSTFNVGLYDANGVETAMANMQNAGYTYIRVWLNGCCHDNTLGNPAGGFSSAYIANVIDFLHRAKNHNILVVIVNDWLPAFGGYTNYGNCTNFSDFNLLNLCAGGVKATETFFHDLVQALINGNAPLDAIFAYQIRSEYFYWSNLPPMSWTSGLVTTADGQPYDMSNATSRQQMMDSGLIYFTDHVRTAIVGLDPTALVVVGFFDPQTPNPTRFGDPRVISIYPAIANSTVDFVGIDPYPIVGDLTLAQYVQNVGFIGYQQQKPVVLEEFGVLEANYPVESNAATVAHDWQVQSCTYGIKGWGFWTWDTSNSEQVDGPFWPASLGAGLIAQTLSPATRPDPCVN